MSDSFALLSEFVTSNLWAPPMQDAQDFGMNKGKFHE